MHIFQKLKFICFFLFASQAASAQAPVKITDGSFGTYWNQRVTFFRSMPQTKGDIIFLGNSITDGGEWSEIFNDLRCKNRGISGDISAGILQRLGEVVNRKPAKIFLLIGINDLARKISIDSLLRNIYSIATQIKSGTPATKLYVQSIMPVNESFGMFKDHVNKTDSVNIVNTVLSQKAAQYNYTFINLQPTLRDANGKLSKEFTNDGLHLTGAGYTAWASVIYPFVFDLNEKPAIIPQPVNIKWHNEIIPLAAFTRIAAPKSLAFEVAFITEKLSGQGFQRDTLNHKPYGNTIILRTDASFGSDTSAYRIRYMDGNIHITAGSATGIFYGIQTFLQMVRKGFVQPADVDDKPAFSWRGFLTDAGRNYQGMPFLKRMIDAAALYKLNVFHFHATEDVAWRIAIRKYPKLTAPETMLRNKGMYYTQDDIRELIKYCHDRHIEFVPEIDMPGHSAAFRKAMGVDMQSDSGIAILKEIIRELMDTYHFKYLHIGADEVKITNKNFVPEMTAFIESFGAKVIGWEPGGNFTTSTLRQLWMDDVAHLSTNDSIKVIDSRHLYINHMDPLEAVPTIFYRQICGVDKGSETKTGATLCLWPDRAVHTEDDILRMNPVFSGMAAFAERSWQGGGLKGWLANIQPRQKEGALDFAAFEQRLMEHKKLYFADVPYPYQAQSGINWDLYGPYANHGNTAAIFAPEQKDKQSSLKPAMTATGGTVVLRHWWAPKVTALLPNADDSTTWYAATKIWADEDGLKKFWIGFNNLSRSPASDAAPAGKWDNKDSRLWVNGIEVPAPVWQRPGRRGNSEEPLLDEDYAYRNPTLLMLKKGWNQVLVKCPVGSFTGRDWQNPVKWMFTFIEVKE